MGNDLVGQFFVDQLGEFVVQGDGLDDFSDGFVGVGVFVVGGEVVVYVGVVGVDDKLIWWVGVFQFVYFVCVFVDQVGVFLVE